MKKYQIRVNDQEYHVEIADLSARPVRVNVEGEWFEVWPEENHLAPRPAAPLPSQEVTPRQNPVPPPAGETTSNGTPSETSRARNSNAIKSPLPGVITAIHITLGEEVSAGQPVCVVEAMKMNNVVRATTNGKVVAVRVTVGQHVKHHDVLVEFV